MSLKDVKHKVELHLKDYKEVRKDVDGIVNFGNWALKVLIGAIILAVLATIGMNK